MKLNSDNKVFNAHLVCIHYREWRFLGAKGAKRHTYTQMHGEKKKTIPKIEPENKL